MQRGADGSDICCFAGGFEQGFHGEIKFRADQFRSGLARFRNRQA
jgi:hypothetical protein